MEKSSSFSLECLLSPWNLNQVDLVHCSWAKQQPNLAIFRNTLNLLHGELTREKAHQQLPVKQKMESVKQYTKSRRILQRNVFRRCTDFTFPVSLLFLLPGPRGEELATMMTPSPPPRLMGREVWPRFRHLSRLLEFNMAGYLAADKLSRGVGCRLGGRGGGQTNTKRNTTCLWTKELDGWAWRDCFLCWGQLIWEAAFLLGIHYIAVCTCCHYSLGNFNMQGFVRHNGGKRERRRRRRCWIDFSSTPWYEKVTLIDAA